MNTEQDARIAASIERTKERARLVNAGICPTCGQRITGTAPLGNATVTVPCKHIWFVGICRNR